MRVAALRIIISNSRITIFIKGICSRNWKSCTKMDEYFDTIRMKKELDSAMSEGKMVELTSFYIEIWRRCLKHESQTTWQYNDGRCNRLGKQAQMRELRHGSRIDISQYEKNAKHFKRSIQNYMQKFIWEINKLIYVFSIIYHIQLSLLYRVYVHVCFNNFDI